MEVLLADVKSANDEFWQNHSRIVAAARKLVAALNNLPRAGDSGVSFGRAGGELFREAIRIGGRFFSLLEQFRAPAYRPYGQALEDGVRALFLDTYGVRFCFRPGKTGCVVVPRDIHCLTAVKQQAERFNHYGFMQWSTGKAELPRINQTLLSPIEQALGRFAEMQPARGLTLPKQANAATAEDKADSTNGAQTGRERRSIVPREFRDEGKSDGEPLTSDYLASHPMWLIKGHVLTRTFQHDPDARMKPGRAFVYRYEKVLALRDRISRSDRENKAP